MGDMVNIIFREPRSLTAQDRLAWFRVQAAYLGLFAPNARKWKWYA